MITHICSYTHTHIYTWLNKTASVHRPKDEEQTPRPGRAGPSCPGSRISTPLSSVPACHSLSLEALP